VSHFIAQFCAENGKRAKALSSEALGYFLAYDWPGNVRELRNMVERLVIMAPGDVITADDLPAPLRPKEAAPPAGEARDRSLKDARDNFERAYILVELRANDGNVTRTAERLGIERSHLYRKLKAYNINPPKRDARARGPPDLLGLILRTCRLPGRAEPLAPAIAGRRVRPGGPP